MNILANSFILGTRLASAQITNATEPHTEQLEAGISILNWLKEAISTLEVIKNIGTLFLFLGLILVSIVLYLFITKKKIINRLKNITKQELKEKQTAYRLDTQLENENEETLIRDSILPTIKCNNRSVYPADGLSLCNFAMERKIRCLIGAGGYGKTSLLLHIAAKFSKKKIKMRQKEIKDGSSNVLVQLFTADQLNEVPHPNTQNNNCLLRIIKERTIPNKDASFLNSQEVIEQSSILSLLKTTKGLRQNKSKRLISPKDTWASFEAKRKNGKNKSCYDFRLLLLIDGYNELNDSVREMLNRELDCIDRNTHGSVSVVVTSRYKPGKWPESACDLCELRIEQIDQYINESVTSTNSTMNNQFRLSPEMKKLLTRPILLTMYCQTCKMTRDLQNYKIPFHSITSMSDIYWNYLCSHLVRSVKIVEQGQESKESLTHKVIILFFVLPCVAMEREANDNGLNFSMKDFQDAVKHIKKNKDVLLGNYNQELSSIISDEALQNLADLEGIFAQNVSARELPMIQCIEQSKGNRRYAFTHEFHRNFFAAVYRIQRDTATLYDADNDKNRYIPYIYSACEKLPDISLVIRKFYYELVAYYFRHVLTHSDRNELISNSVRYNSLLSDMYYYGDAFKDTYPEALQFEQNMEKSLKCSEAAISIGIGRIRNIDYSNPDEMNKKTDMTNLCWARWNATHIIQFDMKSFCSNQNMLKQYREKAYQYSKANSQATGYGEFIGYDKLAHMLYEKGFLPDHIRNKELEAIPETDDSGKIRTKETRIRLLCHEYLQHGQHSGYHFSFNKEAIWLERDLMCIQNSDTQNFASLLNQIYYLLEMSYKCKQNDYYALSRMLFYRICYRDKLTGCFEDSIPTLIDKATSSMSKQLSFHGTNEIYGYDNFCENAGFWYLMQMFSKNSKPNLTNVMELINKISKSQELGCEFDQEAMIQAADYYKKLFISAHTKLGGTFDIVDKKNDGVVKTRLKAVIAYQFVRYIYNSYGSNTGTYPIEALCGEQDLNVVDLQFEKYLNGKENRFFMEERYTTIYNCYRSKVFWGVH